MRRSLPSSKCLALLAPFILFEPSSDFSYRTLVFLSQQVAAQVVHSSAPFQLKTRPAPEPRDIIWYNMTFSQTSLRVRECFVLGSIVLLFFFWVIPITGLASLLSYKEIKKTMPWLGQMIDSNDKIRAIVQNSLPSVAMITLNALLPFILEGMSATLLSRRAIGA